MEDNVWAAQNGLDKVGHAIMSGRYAPVILDEANIAVSCNLFDIDDLINAINNKLIRVEFASWPITCFIQKKMAESFSADRL